MIDFTFHSVLSMFNFHAKLAHIVNILRRTNYSRVFKVECIAILNKAMSCISVIYIKYNADIHNKMLAIDLPIA
jgi:hypothetical protein